MLVLPAVVPVPIVYQRVGYIPTLRDGQPLKDPASFFSFLLLCGDGSKPQRGRPLTLDAKSVAGWGGPKELYESVGSLVEKKQATKVMDRHQQRGEAASRRSCLLGCNEHDMAVSFFARRPVLF